MLADLPWGEYAVKVRISVRRLYCENVRCERRIFTGRMPGAVALWADKTTHLAEQHTAMALALVGTVGIRLGRKLGLNASRNTLLRLVRQAPLPDVTAPSVLGVDDSAHRTRRRYGTVLVDLGPHRSVAPLLSRKADTVATWLRKQPSVAAISRDRAVAFAKGARNLALRPSRSPRYMLVGNFQPS